LQELVREVDPTVQLDDEVEEMLLQLADDFIDTTLNSACALAKHRHAPTVELRDVQLHLGKVFNLSGLTSAQSQTIISWGERLFCLSDI
jgi:transcription initiation factor TFIID subunit 12